MTRKPDDTEQTDGMIHVSCELSDNHAARISDLFCHFMQRYGEKVDWDKVMFLGPKSENDDIIPQDRASDARNQLTLFCLDNE